MRLTEEARDQLVRAADASGRSLAAETEYRLARSFYADEHAKDLAMRIAALEAAAATDRQTIAYLSFTLAGRPNPEGSGGQEHLEDPEYMTKYWESQQKPRKPK